MRSDFETSFGYSLDKQVTSLTKSRGFWRLIGIIMEVAQAEKKYNGNVQHAGRLTWTINNFLALGSEKLYSEVFYAGGYKWRILIYPKGASKDDSLSMYLGVADLSTLPHGRSTNAYFSLAIISQNKKETIKKESEKAFNFNASKSEWGFTSFIPLKELSDPSRGFLVRGACTIEAEVWFNEEHDIEEQKGNEKVDSHEDLKQSVPSKEPTVVEGKSYSSFAELDTLFADIQNLLEGETSKSGNFSSSRAPSWSVEEIDTAKHILKEFVNMDLSIVIQSGRHFELKKSISVLLSSNAFPNNIVDEIDKFLANFDQSCEQYESAEQDLSEAREKEKSVGELKTNIKQLSFVFLPARNQAEAIDREIAKLERQLTEKKAKKARLRTKLEVLASHATTSKQALVTAEQDMKLSMHKKEKAEKVIGDIDKSWKSLKLDYLKSWNKEGKEGTPSEEKREVTAGGATTSKQVADSAKQDTKPKLKENA